MTTAEEPGDRPTSDDDDEGMAPLVTNTGDDADGPDDDADAPTG